MKRFLFILLLVLLSSHSYASSFSLDQFRTQIRGSKVLVFGEEHGSAFNSIQPDIVGEVIKLDPRYDCIGLEYDARAQKFYALADSFEGYKKFLFNYAQVATGSGIRGEFFESPDKNEYIDSLAEMFRTWFEASEVMKSYGGKVFLIDNLRQGGEETFFRNRRMAEKMGKLIKSGQCTKFISFTGNGHVIPDPSVVDYAPYSATGFHINPFSGKVQLNESLNKEWNIFY